MAGHGIPTGPYYNSGPEAYMEIDNYKLAQAQLAVAWELHTANLIAWRNGGKILLKDCEKVDEQIRHRLGLWD